MVKVYLKYALVLCFLTIKVENEKTEQPTRGATIPPPTNKTTTTITTTTTPSPTNETTTITSPLPNDTTTSSPPPTSETTTTTPPPKTTTTIHTCPSTVSEFANIVWPETVADNKAASQPLCINSAKELAYRECLISGWEPEPKCESIQTEQLPQCPENSFETATFCYTFSPKSVYPPKCPFPDVLPFKDVIDFVENFDSVWLPVTRDLSNSIGFLEWVEPSSLYKTEYLDYYYKSGALRDKNCVIMSSSKEVTAVPCNEQHSGVCAYTKLSLIDNAICSSYGSCRQSDYLSKISCFCKMYEGPTGHEAGLVKPYQNSVFPTNEQCSFGLLKDQKGIYRWETTDQEISYTYWSQNVTFDNDHLFGAITPDGWILTQDFENCNLIEIQLISSKPQLTLSLNHDTNQLIVEVTDFAWLQKFDQVIPIFCFTDVDPYSFIYRYTTIYILDGSNQNVSRYTFQFLDNFPGFYWCEAFTFSDLTTISTKPFFYSPSAYFEFVGFFEIEVASLEINPLSSQIISHLNDTLLNDFDGLANNETRYVARLMKIVNLDETNNLMVLNLHFSSYLELNSASDSKKEFLFQELKKMINERLTSGKMITFGSADFCVSETETYPSGVTLTWPTTSAGAETPSTELCFRADGNLTTNVCGGNFTDGYYWMYPFFECTILPQSSISKNILQLYLQDSISEEDMNKLLKIDTTKASAVDVYLVAEIYNKYFIRENNFTIDIFSQSIQLIFKFDPKILLESQLNTRATDRILYVIDKVLKKYQTALQIITNDFAFFLISSDISGIAIQTKDGEQTISTLIGDWSPDRLVQELEYLDFAIWLSPALSDQIDNNSLVAYAVYFNDLLFQEASSQKNVATIFGTVLRNTSSILGPISIIQRMNFDNAITCVSWMYDVAYLGGFWMEDKKPNNVSSYQVCDFWRNANFAMSSTTQEDQNVTADLEGLLDASVADSDKMTQLVTIVEKHEHFKPLDVFLLGRVLDLVKSNTNNDLLCLGTIVNNLHRIQRSVLSESQEQHKATDLILYEIDTIVRNYDNDSLEETLVQTDNFILFMTRKDTNFTGLILHHSNQTFDVEIVRGDFEIVDIEGNISSVVLLSSDLKHQIPDDSKIIVTVFFSDVLFNEEQSNKSVSKIFGVILPDIGDYSGPISIFHNISSTNYNMQCSHWNYTTTNESMSYWQKDTIGVNSSLLSQCDFWHTTHFALLLLNVDGNYTDKVLEWVTIINSSISLLGLFLIIFTAILFKKWRQNIGNQVLLNFSLAIILQLVTLFVAGSVERDFDNICIFIGALLHYTVISQFCWMLTIAFIQFKRFVKVFATSSRYLLLKACICGWFLPLILVVATLIVDRNTYVEGIGGICYPSGLGMYLTVWLPIVLIIGVNVFIFIYIVYSVIQTKVDPVVSSKNDKKHQWRLFVLLFFMLGITWCFGFLSGLGLGTVFVYLFSFTATLQGFVLFLYFILFNSNTRRLYVQGVKNMCFKKEL